MDTTTVKCSSLAQSGHGAEGTGDELDANAALKEEGDHGLNFAVAHERVATDEGEMEGFEAVDHFEDAELALAVGKAAKRGASAEVAVIIGVAAGSGAGILW